MNDDFVVSTDGLPSRMLKIREFAAFFDISRSTAWAFIADGTVPVVRIAGSTRIAPATVQRLVREGIARKEKPNVRSRGR